MAGIEHVMLALAPLLATIPQYIGQEPPNDYINKIIQIFTYGTALGVGAFNDAVKTQILASKMAGKYVPPNPFNNQAGDLVNTPALFRPWLNIEYQRQTIGTQQVATQRLTQEKFTPYDTPETYETRIKPLLLGIANNDAYVLGVLKNQLPTELFNRMSIAPYQQLFPTFFTRLKNMWLNENLIHLHMEEALVILMELDINHHQLFNHNLYFNPQPQQINPIQNIQNPSQPVVQPHLQSKDTYVSQNPPLPPGHEYRLDEFHTNNFVDEWAKQHGYTLTRTPLSKLPPGGKKVRPKSEKAKAYEEMIEHAKLGIEIEDDRPDDPMEVDLALVNLVRRIGGNISIPTTRTVNATRTVRKKKSTS